MLAAADVVAIAAAAIALGIVQEPLDGAWAAALLPLWIVLAKFHGLYDRDHAKIRHLTLDELPGLFYWTTLSVAATALVFALSPSLRLTGPGAVVMWASAFAVSFAGRAAARALWRSLVPPQTGVVIGDGCLAQAVKRKLQLERGHHIRLLPPLELPGCEFELNGSASEPTDLEGFIRRLGVSRVVLAQQNLSEATLSTVVSVCRANGVRLSVAPPLQAMHGTAVNLNHLAELPVVEFRTWAPSRSTAIVKRAVDLIGAGCGMIVLLPIMVATAVAIRLESRGPVLFSQLRAGKDGKPFRMLKFRTMVHDAEARLADVIHLPALPEPMFKLRLDPRVTRVGRFLRCTSLDELPQLLNVLRGEMSLVGPRPEEVQLVERYTDAERCRLAVRPGITGPMQVHGRGELTFAERLAVEREYIENYSLRKDLKIMLETVVAVLRRQGAF